MDDRGDKSSIQGSRWDEDRVPGLWRSLHKEIRRRGISVHDADDVTQEAWLRTVRHPPDQSGLKSWLRVVGLRVLCEVARRDHWRIEREKQVARHDLAAEDQSSEDCGIFKLAKDLPSPYCEVVLLRYLHDLQVEEIAIRRG